MFAVLPAMTIFISVLIFIGVTMKVRSRKYGKDFEDFITEERNANALKSKPIEENRFFTPDLTLFPIKPYANGDDLVSRQQIEVVQRGSKKMIRFDAPMTNLELKHKYGTVNLEKITEHEENFFTFIYAVNSWAEAMITAEDFDGAEKALKGGIKCGAETSKTYTMLADIYFRLNKKSEMRELHEAVKNSNMPAQEKTLDYIGEYCAKMGA